MATAFAVSSLRRPDTPPKVKRLESTASGVLAGTVNLPRNRGAACPLLPRLGMPLKIAQTACNSKGLNQTGSVCAASAKRDFARHRPTHSSFKTARPPHRDPDD